MKKRDLTNQVFGKLHVIEQAAHASDGNVQWLCRCDCGNETVVRSAVLLRGGCQSCGCLARKLSSGRQKTHGMSQKNLTYHSWQSMIQRTTNENSKMYKDYGAKGIMVDQEWTDFRNFLADMGERPHGTTLDRIDNAQGYFKGNCRWSTPAEQTRNRSNTVWLTDGKRVMCRSDWADELGLHKTASTKRLQRVNFRLTEV